MTVTSALKIKKNVVSLGTRASSPAGAIAGDIFVTPAGALQVHNGSVFGSFSSDGTASTLQNKTIDATQNTILNIANANIATGAAIAYSKLNLLGSIVNADIASAAGIVYSKLLLTSSIVNADVAAAAAIAYSKLLLTNSIVNADIAAAAAIAYTKLNLSASVVNADIAAAAAIAYSKLNLSGSIVNADVALAAAIAYSKLALTNSIVNNDIAAAAGIVYSKLLLTNSVVNADIAAAAAIAYSKLNLTGSIVNADVAAAAAIALTKLAAVTGNRALASNTSGFIVASAVTDTELGFLSGVTSSVQTQLNGKLNLTGGTLTGFLTLHADPTSALHAASKQYVDNLLNGVRWKQPVLAASTANVTISSAPATLDGVTLTSGDRVLLKDQSTTSQNGIYIFNGTGSALTRATDFDTVSPVDEINAAAVIVRQGTVNADRGYVETAEVATVGTDPISFVQFTSSGSVIAGTAIDVTGQTVSVRYDTTTIDVNGSNQIRVADGAITNAKVNAAAAIAYSKLNLSNSIVNADVATGAAIAYSKLALTNSVVNADIAAAAAIAYTKLALTNSIVNADIAAAAAIAYSKLLLTNSIVNADIATGAAIDALKIGAGAVSSTEFGYLDGVTSSIQTQINGKLSLTGGSLSGALTMSDTAGSGFIQLNTQSGGIANATSGVRLHGASNALVIRDTAGNQVLLDMFAMGSRSISFPAADGTIALIGATQTLSNKTITEPLFNSYVDFAHVTLPANPAASRLRVYAKNDNKIYKLTSAGVESELGTGAGGSGSSGINYIANSGFEDSTVTGWVAYADAAGVAPVDGTGGSPVVTVTNTGTTPVRGTRSLLLTKDASNRQGQGISYNFTIDAADVNKAISVSFDFEASANFVTGDAKVYLYDVTNSVLLNPSSLDVAGGRGTYTAAFVTTSAVSYRLIVHVASVNATAYTLKADNFAVGPQTKGVNAAITDWQPYTPTVGLTNATTLDGRWKRDGDDMLVQFNVGWGATAPTGTSLTVSIPSGFLIDTTKLPGGAAEMTLGTLGGVDAGVAWVGGWIQYETTTTIRAQAKHATTYHYNPVTPTAPFTIASGDRWTGEFRIPIVGWSTNVQMADRALEEYASNTNSTATAVDTTTFAYGPQGALFPNGAVGTNYQRQVQFQSPVQVTDNVFVEVDTTGSGFWVPMVNQMPYIQQGTNTYGISMSRVNSTTFNVVFRAGGYVPSGVTYAANGAPWSELNTLGWKWRVRKVTGGAAVGFPLSGRNVLPEEVINPLITGSTTIEWGPGIYLCSSGSPFTAMLTTAVDKDGKLLRIKNIGTATVTLDANSTETIDGNLTFTLNAKDGVTLVAYNGNWHII